ncbi:MAG TPA: ornithine cyclodeaminase family protein [Terriglobia bacterium]|nr:ornithine cyclodeaminase family protein [Terriglobia bacterium]
MLLLSETDVQQLLPMEKAIERVEASFLAQHRGEAINRSRERILLHHSSLHYMAAALPAENLLGVKIYTVTRSAWRFVVLLFDSEGGDLLAMIEADHLGRIRTGAATGVATKYMARADASQVGLIGAGRQARTQLEAVVQVRKVEGVRVFSRDPERRLAFSHQMRERLGVTVRPAETAEQASRPADIVITATTSTQPLLLGDWLRPGAHVNAIGANMANRREVDDRTLDRAAVIAVDSLAQSKQEAGDLIQGFAHLAHGWDGAVELQEIVAGNRTGRSSDQEITLFKSTGIALWDVAVAGFIYQEARRQGRGEEVAMWQR